ncbi:MAG: pentapeptide repeat-containing protein [Chroococcidiopsidaceae cyanobacterium CP_BM_ER_R8_30]|nr:pentapeptide repeat-containing protein [Chroococcidiopsidaceae cyanobacterium CP_BM_ER_R8_30]
MSPDFSAQDLRGRSFAGLDLSGANFSAADIRGTDFSHAILRGANFSQVKAGLPSHWSIGLVLSSWLLSGFSGMWTGLGSNLVALSLDGTHPNNFNTGVVSSMMLIIFLIILLHYGLGKELLAFIFVMALAFDIAAALEIAMPLVFSSLLTVTLAAAGSLAVGVAVALAGIGVTTMAFMVAMLIVIWDGTRALAVGVTVTVILSGACVGWRTRIGDEKYTLLQDLVRLLTVKGTSFRSADLTEANFTQAELPQTDLRDAILTRTCWEQVKWH